MHCINECYESHEISLVGVGGGRGSSIWVVAEKLKGAWNSWQLSWIYYQRYRLDLPEDDFKSFTAERMYKSERPY